MRGATWLDLQWRTSDPDGAPVKDCCVEAFLENHPRRAKTVHGQGMLSDKNHPYTIIDSNPSLYFKLFEEIVFC